jgi:hypothetical protein
VPRHHSVNIHYRWLDELWGVVLPELDDPELLESELPDVLEPLLLPLGLSAPPVAELPDNPKYENTLWRQLG